MLFQFDNLGEYEKYCNSSSSRFLGFTFSSSFLPLVLRGWGAVLYPDDSGVTHFLVFASFFEREVGVRRWSCLMVWITVHGYIYISETFGGSTSADRSFRL